MRETVYIVADAWGVKRMAKRTPQLARSEIAVKLTLAIPDGCFRSPVISAVAEVPESHVMQPTCSVEVQPAGEDT